MKKIILIAFAVHALTAFRQIQAQRISVDFNTFYTQLSPYGRWIDYPDYGRVWICNERGFRPYYNDGHWVYTDVGWAWISDYPWGWAPFHYGRWLFSSEYGWVWVPGYEWAPAWVTWCESDNYNYYGWTPLSPGLSLNISFASVPAERWIFIPKRYITNPSMHNYYVNPSGNTTIIRNTTIINNVRTNNNVHYYAGPQRADVERVAKTKIRPVAVHDAPAPGKPTVNNQVLNIYKPRIKKNIAIAPSVVNRQSIPVTKNTSPVENKNPAKQQVLQQKHQDVNQQKKQDLQIQPEQVRQKEVKQQPEQQVRQQVNQSQQEEKIRQQKELQQQRNQQPEHQHQQQVQQQQQEKIPQQRELQQQQSQQQQQEKMQQQRELQQQRNQQRQQERVQQQRELQQQRNQQQQQERVQQQRELQQQSNQQPGQHQQQVKRGDAKKNTE